MCSLAYFAAAPKNGNQAIEGRRVFKTGGSGKNHHGKSKVKNFSLPCSTVKNPAKH